MAGTITLKDLVKFYRTEVVKQSQSELGKQFGVTHAAVSEWESGKSNIPNEVVEMVLDKVGAPELQWKTCPRCAGVGKISTWSEWLVGAQRNGYAQALYHAGIPYKEAFQYAIRFEAKEAIAGLAKEK